MVQELQKITDYLSALPGDQQEALESLRGVIQDAIPDAGECISYGLPAFCLGNRPLVAYGAGKKHCAFYPLDPELLEAHLGELEAFETSKGTIRFQPDGPIPRAVVKRIVRERAATIRASD